MFFLVWILNQFVVWLFGEIFAITSEIYLPYFWTIFPFFRHRRRSRIPLVPPFFFFCDAYDCLTYALGFCQTTSSGHVGGGIVICTKCTNRFTEVRFTMFNWKAFEFIWLIVKHIYWCEQCGLKFEKYKYWYQILDYYYFLLALRYKMLVLIGRVHTCSTKCSESSRWNLKLFFMFKKNGEKIFQRYSAYMSDLMQEGRLKIAKSLKEFHCPITYILSIGRPHLSCCKWQWTEWYGM